MRIPWWSDFFYLFASNCVMNPPVGCFRSHYVGLICMVKADTILLSQWHWSDTAGRTFSPRPRLSVTVAIVINTIAHGVTRSWILHTAAWHSVNRGIRLCDTAQKQLGEVRKSTMQQLNCSWKYRNRFNETRTCSSEKSLSVAPHHTDNISEAAVVLARTAHEEVVYVLNLMLRLTTTSTVRLTIHVLYSLLHATYLLIWPQPVYGLLSCFLYILLPPPKEVMFLVRSVCLFVCLFVCLSVGLLANVNGFW